MRRGVVRVAVLVVCATVGALAQAKDAASSAMDRDLMEISVPQLEQLYAQHRYTVAQVTKWYLDRIERYDGTYRAVLYLDGAAALRRAAEEDAEPASARRGALWGVPIVVFVRTNQDGSVEILKDARVNERIFEAFEREGADAWYEEGAAARFLKPDYDPADWQKVDDILDVWFDSGSTHAFTLETRPDLMTRRKYQGGDDVVMYLEGSDQHRGWFQSSLLESTGTRAVAPYDVVVTHGFTLDEQGRKMAKSLGNGVDPQDVIQQSGADILRQWVCATDYWDDQRIGPEILKTTVETYRKLRNTIRWMLGNLAHFSEEDRVDLADCPELERVMLHRLVELDRLVRQAYADFDYKRIFAALNAFMTVDLSAFYFDVRKDVLYCDPISSVTRKACLTVLDHLFRCTVIWLAPMLCFTAEEAWLARDPHADSVHLELFPELPTAWRDEALADKWRKVRLVRRVVTGALEIERAAKRIGMTNERSLSGISAGGGGRGAARLIRSSASASRTADPELLTILQLTTLPCRSIVNARLTTPWTPRACAG